MSIYSVVLFLIVSLSSVDLSHASEVLRKEDEGLKNSAFRNFPNEMIIAPLKILIDAELITINRSCKTFRWACIEAFRQRLLDNPSTCWVPFALESKTNWQIIYFEQRLFDTYLCGQTQGGALTFAQRTQLKERFNRLKVLPRVVPHPLRPLLQEVVDIRADPASILKFDQAWQARMTDLNQSALAHELRSYMYALDAVPAMHPVRHWAVAAFRDLFGLQIQADPNKMFDLARACGITAAQLGRTNALHFLIATQVDMSKFLDLTDEIANKGLGQAALFYAQHEAMMEYVQNITQTNEKSLFYDRAMDLAKDLARSGSPRAFQRLSLRYHLDAAIAYYKNLAHENPLGMRACDDLYLHVQSLDSHAPHSVKILLAQMYREYLQKYTIYNTAEKREKIRQLEVRN